MLDKHIVRACNPFSVKIIACKGIYTLKSEKLVTRRIFRIFKLFDVHEMIIFVFFHIQKIEPDIRVGDYPLLHHIDFHVSGTVAGITFSADSNNSAIV